MILSLLLEELLLLDDLLLELLDELLELDEELLDELLLELDGVLEELLELDGLLELLDELLELDGLLECDELLPELEEPLLELPDELPCVCVSVSNACVMGLSCDSSILTSSVVTDGMSVSSQSSPTQ